MWINKKKRICSQDSILSGFTYQDLIDTAQANGDSIPDTFQSMVNECKANAYDNLFEVLNDLQTITNDTNRRN